MKNFTYFRPSTAEQAVGLLENTWGNTAILAGGTDLLDLQKEYVAQPGRVISLGGIGALSGITVEDKQVRIGAGTKIGDIAVHAELRRLFPSLTEAAAQIGGPQIRNMGTLGGNLCQRNRCWYFRDEHVNCLLKGGPRCYALEGENKYHAVFTQGHRCVIVHPSTLAPALLALGATIEVLGPTGRRTQELAKFFHAPVNANEREHTLAANEMILSVTIPRRNLTNASYEIRHKQAYDWPLVQVAVSFEGGRAGANATNPVIVLGHVSPVPRLTVEAAAAINNRAITDATAAAAGRAATEGAKPLAQNQYKLRLIEVAVKRALFIAAGMKRYWEV